MCRGGLGALVRVIAGCVSIDWLHEVEGFQHFFRCGDVFQVFSAWPQPEFYGILLDVYLLDDEIQVEGDVSGPAASPTSGSLKGDLIDRAGLYSPRVLPQLRPSFPSLELWILMRFPGSTGSCELQVLRVSARERSSSQNQTGKYKWRFSEIGDPNIVP